MENKEQRPLFLGFSSQKGGVGKSTLAEIVSSILYYEQGINLFVMDCDLSQDSFYKLREREKSIVQESEELSKSMQEYFHHLGKKAYRIYKSAPKEAVRTARSKIDGISNEKYQLVIFDFPGHAGTTELMELSLQMDYILSPIEADIQSLVSCLAYAKTITEIGVSMSDSRIKDIILFWNKVDRRVRNIIIDEYTKLIHEYELTLLPGYGLTLDDEAHRLYIVDTRGGTLMVYDTTLGQVTSSVTMPPVLDAQGKPEKIEYREIVVDKANNRLYLPAMSYHDSKLQVVNLDTLTVERTIPGFNFGATGISMDSGAGKLYVSNLMGQLFVVDIGTLAITDRFEVQGDQLLNLVVDHDNKRLLAVDQGFDRLDVVRKERGGLNYQTRTQGNQVLALDPSSGKVLQNIKVGTQPVAMLLDAPRNRLYVSNRVSSNISVVDPRTGQEIKTIDLPTHPNSFALNPKTGTVYVTVKLPKEKSMTDKESVARISF